MDLEDGLCVETTAVVGATGREQARVEAFEVFGAEVTDRDATEVGEDVELDVASIAVPSARSQCELLGGKPVAGQGHTERRPDAATVTAMSRSETCSERFGLGPVGARRVPPAALPTRDRVDAFVDHRVEAVPS